MLVSAVTHAANVTTVTATATATANENASVTTTAVAIAPVTTTGTTFSVNQFNSDINPAISNSLKLYQAAIAVLADTSKITVN